MTINYIAPAPKYSSSSSAKDIVGARKARNNRNRMITLVDGISIDQVRCAVNKVNMKDVDRFFRFNIFDVDDFARV